MSFKRAVENWFDEWTGWIIGGSLIGLALLMFIGFICAATDDSERKFISECSDHEPHYQCVAKWRAGEPKTVVVPTPPVVVPVPARR